MKTYYITTPLYYVNASPHIGHAYTNIIADSLNRFLKINDINSFFLTGTDEHGQKIYQASQEAKKSPQEFVDAMVENFKSLWKILNVEFDDFIRTTEERHTKVVRKVLEILLEKKDIYVGDYEGFYCIPCETFWCKEEIENFENPLCPSCQRSVEFLKEKNYFFRLSLYQDWLYKYIDENPDFIKPRARLNEVLGFLKTHKLEDLCISRPRKRVNWGIDVPFSKEHVVYVWFDALLNYISSCGFGFDPDKFSHLWPADVHFIGKDILRQHALIWPIILKALGLEPPRRVFSHGWWLIKKEETIEKMSKSKGNVIDPLSLVEEFGADALRYFLLRQMPLGEDGSFSLQALIEKINSDLANDLGNLVYRVVNMQEKYFHSRIALPKKKRPDPYFSYFLDKKQELFNLVYKDMNFYSYLENIWEFINRANKFVEIKRPWQMYKEKREEELKEFIYNLLEVLRIVAILTWPIIPQTTNKILEQLSLDREKELKFEKGFVWGLLKEGQIIKKFPPLFPRIL